MSLVVKPWGREHRIELNRSVALTHLLINPGSGTSMHCHPTKTTSLLCMDGEGKINFLNSSFALYPGNGFTIRNGLFHRIQNENSNHTLRLLEFENPIDRNDLVRFSDEYGRTDLPYENDSTLEEDDETTLKILALAEKGHPIENKYWSAVVLENLDLIDISEDVMLVVLEGGMYDLVSRKPVLRPADCVSLRTIRLLKERFKILRPLRILAFTIKGTRNS